MLLYILGIVGQSILLLMALLGTFTSSFLPQYVVHIIQGVCFFLLLLALLHYYDSELKGRRRRRTTVLLFLYLVTDALWVTNSVFSIVDPTFGIYMALAAELLLLALIGSTLADDDLDGPKQATTALVLKVGSVLCLGSTFVWTVPYWVIIIVVYVGSHIGTILFLRSTFAKDWESGSSSYYSGGGYYRSSSTYTYTLKYWYPN